MELVEVKISLKKKIARGNHWGWKLLALVLFSTTLQVFHSEIWLL